MIEQIITQDAFAEQVQAELTDLLKSAGDEYAPELQTLSLQFAEQYYRYLNGATDADRRSAEANIRHIKAALTHISADFDHADGARPRRPHDQNLHDHPDHRRHRGGQSHHLNGR